MQNLVSITKNVYWMPFPKKEKIIEISKLLNNTFGPRFQIWNLSEHDYEREFFHHQVAMHRYIGFSSPPLYELLLVCKCILEWIKQDNIAIIHCQSSKGRSVLLSTLLLSYINNQNLMECYTIVCRMLQIKSIFPTQTFTLNCLNSLQLNEPMNKESIRIKSIILSQTPNKMQVFRPFLQIINRTEILYQEKNQEILQNESCVFILPNLLISQDIVIKCKQIDKEMLIPIFRIQLHTSFIHNSIIRLRSNDIDLINDKQFDETFFIDIILSVGNQNWNAIDLEQKKVDYQTQEGLDLILKLQETCVNLSQDIKFELFQENIMQQTMIELPLINHNHNHNHNQQNNNKQNQNPDEEEDDIII